MDLKLPSENVHQGSWFTRKPKVIPVKHVQKEKMGLLTRSGYSGGVRGPAHDRSDLQKVEPTLLSCRREYCGRLHRSLRRGDEVVTRSELRGVRRLFR